MGECSLYSLIRNKLRKRKGGEEEDGPPWTLKECYNQKQSVQKGGLCNIPPRRYDTQHPTWIDGQSDLTKYYWLVSGIFNHLFFCGFHFNWSYIFFISTHILSMTHLSN